MSGLRRSAKWAAAILTVRTGAAAAARAHRRRHGDHRAYILEYHDVVSDGPEREGAVSAARLQRHLGFVQRQFPIVSLAHAAAALASPEGLDSDVAVLTFDDGLAGTYAAAWPVLRRMHAPATVFLTTGFLDGTPLWFDRALRCFAAVQRRSPHLPERLRAELTSVLGEWPMRMSPEAAVERLKYQRVRPRNEILDRIEAACGPLAAPAAPLRWEQVREMHAGGIAFGAHTVTHPILSTLPAAEQDVEIRFSRDRIGSELGTVPTLFAYPNGAARDFTPLTVDLVRGAGFTAACATTRGSNRAGGDGFGLHRIGIGAEPCFVLGARLAGVFDDRMRAWLPPRLRTMPGHAPVQS